MINVHPDNDDPFYRYKMPKLMAKIEGCGNGIKTVVVNMSAISKALNRSPEYTTKFFGCELGAQVQMNQKEDRWILNGAHEAAKLQGLLGVFIKRFVLCENCENPETDLYVSRGEIGQKCKACGHDTFLPTGHRLCNYIVNHTPEMLSGAKNNGKQKKGKKNKGTAEIVPASAIEIELTNAVDDINSFAFGDEDKQWTGGETEEQISADIQKLSVSEAKKPETDPADAFFQFVKKQLGAKMSDKSISSIYEEADRLDLLDDAPILLTEVLFTSGEFKDDFSGGIGRYRNLLGRFCRGNPRAEKKLLAGIEQTMAFNRDLIEKAPFVFMELYESDLVSEDTFREWSSRKSKKYLRSKELVTELHKAAKPFIDWLDEAEEEQEEKEEKTDDVEVVFSFRNEADIVANKEEKVNGDKAKGDDELDIDAI